MKVEAVVRKILEIGQTDPEGKIIVFSTVSSFIFSLQVTRPMCPLTVEYNNGNEMAELIKYIKALGNTLKAIGFLKQWAFSIIKDLFISIYFLALGSLYIYIFSSIRISIYLYIF